MKRFLRFAFLWLPAAVLAGDGMEDAKQELLFGFEVVETREISGRISTLPGVSLTVDWGDGSSETFTGSRQRYARDYGRPTHATVRLYGKREAGLLEFEMDHDGGNVRFGLEDLPRELQRLVVLGANTVHGDLADLPRGMTYFRCEGANRVQGDLAHLPAGLIYFRCRGRTTVGGDLADLPEGLTRFDVAGDNVVTGDVANLPAGVTAFYVFGRNTIEGALSAIPRSMRDFRCDGRNTLQGDLADLPRDLQYFLCGGDSRVHGDLAGLPAGLRMFQLFGANTVHGDLAGLPRELTSFRCHGANTIHGDIAGLPRGLTSYQNIGRNTAHGDVADLPRGLTWFRCYGYNALSGDIADLPRGLRLFNLRDDSSNTLRGDVAHLPSDNLQHFLCWGRNTIGGDIADLPPGLISFDVRGEKTLYAGIRAAVGDHTGLELDGEWYGARPDARGPLGGGEGYRDIITGGDVEVATLEELVDALTLAEEGTVVFLPGEAEIDLTSLKYIEDFELEIPAGVTLAGDRGHRGSPGALIHNDHLGEAGALNAMIRVMGPDVRITGLRIRGPNPHRRLDHNRRAGQVGATRGRDYYYAFPTQRGITTDQGSLRIDNCELSGFGHSAIHLREGTGHHVHHNFIHHNQHMGLGYGVVMNRAHVLIEYNLFDFNRHSIAGTGRSPGGYIARHNLERGVSLSHCFDMHREPEGPLAGRRIEIYNNTFLAPQLPVHIRGRPEEACRVYRNWFPMQPRPSLAVRGGDRPNVHVYDNAYGPTPQAPQ